MPSRAGAQEADESKACWCEDCAIGVCTAKACPVSSLLRFLPAGLRPSPPCPRSWKHAHTSPAPYLHWALWLDSWLCQESPSSAACPSLCSGLCPWAVCRSMRMCLRCLPGLSLTEVLLYHLLDYAKGFGGKYGVQKDRMDKVRLVSYGRDVLPRALSSNMRHVSFHGAEVATWESCIPHVAQLWVHSVSHLGLRPSKLSTWSQHSS